MVNADFVITRSAVIKLVELYGHLHIDFMGFGVFIIIMRRGIFANCGVKLCAFALPCTLQCLEFACCLLVLVLSLLSV
jgi:hypothetical protein